MNNNGILFLVVGNSGSGKDSIISGVKKQWSIKNPKLIVPRRYITRSKHPSEKFHSISKEKFTQLKEKGKFIFTWHSYENDYGILSLIHKWLEMGQFVMVNVSRKILKEAKQKYPNCKIIFVKIPYEISEKRIRSRRREIVGSEIYRARLERARKT